MKSFVALIIVSLFSVLNDTDMFFNWTGLQCYNCIYVEDLCGSDCKNGDNLVTGIIGGANREIMAGTYCKFNRQMDATSELNGTITTRYGSNTEHRKHQAYCLHASLQREDGKEMIYRSYGWFADHNLDGQTKKDVHFLIDGTSYTADLHICNKLKCNGSDSLEIGVPSFTELVASILVKFMQSIMYFGCAN